MSLQRAQPAFVLRAATSTRLVAWPRGAAVVTPGCATREAAPGTVAAVRRVCVQAFGTGGVQCSGAVPPCGGRTWHHRGVLPRSLGAPVAGSGVRAGTGTLHPWAGNAHASASASSRASSRASSCTSSSERGFATVAVGMSGGVDSSVCALLLKQAGHDVIGVHMRNWDASDEAGEQRCSQDEDVRYATQACKQLGIPLEQVDLIEPYWNSVFTPFLDAYASGVTPNPDVWCNREIKFGVFHEHCTRQLGVDAVATGHYCRTLPVGGDTSSGGEGAGSPTAGLSDPVRLLRGVDDNKDQSYFLCMVKRAMLAKVRAIAEEAGLVTAARRDSYGICFIGKRKMANFLPEYIPVTPGCFVDVDTGVTIGEHKGAELFTVGQNARINGSLIRWFVCGSDVRKGDVYVAQGTDHPALFSSFVETPADEFNWLEPGAVPDDGAPVRCRFRVRYGHDEMLEGEARLVQRGDGGVDEGGDGTSVVRVDFDAPQRAVTRGQAVALYALADDGEHVLGGGTITAVGRNSSSSD